MVEFFNNIWGWIVENSGKIELILTSSTFGTLVATIVAIITQTKSIKLNNTNLNTMNKNFVSLENVDNNTKSLLENVKVLKDGAEYLKENVIDKIRDIDCKLDAIINVQSIVYSTIKNDTIRNSVFQILTEAKYPKGKTIRELEEELIATKKELSEKLKDVKIIVDDVDEKAEAEAEAEAEEKTNKVTVLR